MTAKTLLVLLAHPDDESFSIGGTLARSVTEGKFVHLVLATRGEAGIGHFYSSRLDPCLGAAAELRRLAYLHPHRTAAGDPLCGIR